MAFHLKPQIQRYLHGKDLSRQATDGTVFLTCWMTMAQVEKLRTKKVMFEDLE